MGDEDEYYKQFLESITQQRDLPSDEEDFLAGEEPNIDSYSARVSRTELVDLVLDSERSFKPIRTVYRPVMPVYIPKYINRTVYFTREQRIALLLQIEMLVQLLVQAVFLSKKAGLREECANILHDILTQCPVRHPQSDISYLINGRAKVAIPTQVSLLHIPLVEVVRHHFHPRELVKANFTRREVKDTLSSFAPAFFSKYLIPLEDPPIPRKNKHGFTILDDMLLLQGLVKSTDPDYIHDKWLINKSPQQIKNRVKNLKSKKYTAKNEAQYRIMKFLEDRKRVFTEEEHEMLRRGTQWFGVEKIFLIQKYFLPHRTVKQLTEAANSQKQQVFPTFTQESFEDIESCNCTCQCQDLFEVYYLP